MVQSIAYIDDDFDYTPNLEVIRLGSDRYRIDEDGESFQIFVAYFDANHVRYKFLVLSSPLRPMPHARDWSLRYVLESGIYRVVVVYNESFIYDRHCYNRLNEQLKVLRTDGVSCIFTSTEWEVTNNAYLIYPRRLR